MCVCVSVCGDHVRDNPNGREGGLNVCENLNTHQSGIRLYLQGDPCNHIQRVNDVAQRFAHFPSMGVPHHCMQIDLQERAGIN